MQLAFTWMDQDNDQLISGPPMFYELQPDKRRYRGDVVRWVTEDELAALRRRLVPR